jgi:hypothetical protein
VSSFFSPLCYLHATGYKSSSLRRTRDSSKLKHARFVSYDVDELINPLLKATAKFVFLQARKRRPIFPTRESQPASFIENARGMTRVESPELTRSLKIAVTGDLCDETYTRRVFIRM